MLGIFKWVWSGVKSIGQAIAMPFIQVRSSSRLQATVRWSIHVLAVVGSLVGLWFLNYSMRLDTMLLAPLPVLRSIWLPLLGLQIYIVSWIGWWLCQMMTSRHQAGAFPDLDKAWDRVEAELVKAKIDITNTPLFLLLGKPSESTANFLNAGKVARTLPAIPKEDEAPFQVYANDEAIYLCCEEVSLLGAQAELFNQAKIAQPNRSANVGGFTNKDFPKEPVSTTAFAAQTNTENQFSFPDQAPTFGNAGTAGIATQVKPAASTSLSPEAIEARSMALLDSNLALLENEFRTTPETCSEPETNVYQPKRRMRTPLLQDEAIINSKTLRLKHLCKIIYSARAPFCPINGVVALIPFAASENEEVANHNGMLIERDLQAISAATMVDPPKLAVLTDIQQSVGCSELIARFPEEQRHRRLGVKFPRVPNCDREQMDGMIGSGLDWLCQKMVPPIVNRLFQTERNSTEEGPVNEANRRLFHFANEIRARQSAFARIIRRAFLGNHSKHSLLRGCYLSACGKDTISQQAFTAGILSQIHEMQNDVAWTEQALDRDKDFQRWTITGYAGLGLVVTIALASFLF